MIVHEGLTTWGAKSVTASPCLRGYAAAKALTVRQGKDARERTKGADSAVRDGLSRHRA